MLKDVAPHVATPPACRALGELLDGLAAPSHLSTLVLPGVRVELAPAIEARAIRYELALPSRGEYRRTVAAVVESLGATGRSVVSLGPDDVDALAVALTGLTTRPARPSLERRSRTARSGAVTPRALPS